MNKIYHPQKNEKKNADRKGQRFPAYFLFLKQISPIDGAQYREPITDNCLRPRDN